MLHCNDYAPVNLIFLHSRIETNSYRYAVSDHHISKRILNIFRKKFPGPEDHVQLPLLEISARSLRRSVSNAGNTGGGPVNTQHHMMSGEDAQRTTEAPK